LRHQTEKQKQAKQTSQNKQTSKKLHKMKKVLFAAAIVLTAATSAKAQTSTSANAVLNVNVSNVKSISVSSGSTVNIDLNTPGKFTNAASATGVSGNEFTTLDVISSGAFKVQVSLEGNATTLNNTNANATGLTSIPVSNIYLHVDNPRQIVSGSGAPSAVYVTTPQNLINQSTSLIATPEAQATSNYSGTAGTKYDVHYKLANFGDVASLATGTFAATVVYTITDL
jgi:hypothetical protein